MWSAQLISTFGDALTQLAAGILVFRLTGSALSVGLMFAVTMLPTLLVGLVAGVYVDRWDRKKILVASCFAQALFVALIPLLLPAGIVWLYVLVALSSTVRQFFDPAASSVQPDIVGDEALDSANAFLSMSATASQILGFAAAGLLAVQVSLSWVFLVDALTFVVAGLCLLNVTVPKHAPSDGEDVSSVLGDVRSGMAHLFGTPVLRAIMLLSLSFGVAISSFNTLSLPFVLSQLQGGSEFVFGIQESVMAAGYVLGSLTMASLASRLAPRSWMALCLLGMGGFTLVYALGNSVLLIILVAGLFGFFNAPINIAMKTLFQRHTPTKLRGRVFGAYYVGLDTVWLLGALAGGLGDVLGLRLMLLGVGLVTMAMSLLAALMPGLGVAKTEAAPHLAGSTD